MNGAWLQSTRPITLCGRSGGGKTTMARCLIDHFDGPSIFFDIDEEPAMGHEVRSVDELREALAAGREKICFRTPEHVVEDPDAFEDVVRFLIEFGNRLREQDAGPMIFVFDELQDLDEKWVKVAEKRLRKRQIKPVGMSQDPVSVPKRVRTIAEWNCWISPPNGEMMDFIRQSGYPGDLLEDLPAHDMLVFDSNWQVVDRVRADESYAVE